MYEKGTYEQTQNDGIQIDFEYLHVNSWLEMMTILKNLLRIRRWEIKIGGE